LSKVPSTARLALALLFLMALSLAAQEAETGFAMPISITVGASSTSRLATWHPEVDLQSNQNRWNAGFRALLTPSLKLSRNWFAYSAVQLHSNRFFYYEAFHSPQYHTGWRDRFPVHLLQGFVAYDRRGESRSLTVKAGQLATAFGSFAMRYTDTANPLIDQPASSGSYLLLRPDQLPCTVQDFQDQQVKHPNIASYPCAGGYRYHYGIFPVTMYGLPGAEVNLTLKDLDARLQLTNSSPANPKNLLQASQHAQWVLGGGYTPLPGLRIGASGFRGPWLEDSLDRRLSGGLRARHAPASGLGLDLQWARSRWSVNAEWQRFVFRYPVRLRSHPSLTYGYTEVKTILTPRLYVAVRPGYQNHNLLPGKRAVEFAVGFRPNRSQLLKVGYLWTTRSPAPLPNESVLGFQLVTSLPGPAKAWR